MEQHEKTLAWYNKYIMPYRKRIEELEALSDIQARLIHTLSHKVMGVALPLQEDN